LSELTSTPKTGPLEIRGNNISRKNPARKTMGSGTESCG